MELHAKNLAMAAGASAEEADAVGAKMVEEKDISAKKAGELLAQMRKGKKQVDA
jgi:hydroxymethylglutaryl-CoA reductase